MEQTDKISFNAALRQISLKKLALISIITFIILIIIDIIFDYGEDLFFDLWLLSIFLYFIYKLKGSIGIKYNFKEIFTFNNQKEIWFVVVTNLLFAFGVIALMSLIEIYVSDFGSTDQLALQGNSINTFLYEALSSVIIAPVIEELLFRGVLFNRLSLKIKVIPAIIISSIIFASLHQFGGITSAFLFGVCMCIIYYKTDNIFLTMTVHFLNNLFCVFIDLFDYSSFFAEPLVYPVLIISVIGALLLIIYIVKNLIFINRNK